MLGTLPLPSSIPTPTVGLAAIAGTSPETAAFSALLGAVENAVIVEIPAAPALDVLPIADGKTGKVPGKILPDLPGIPVEEIDGEEPAPEAMPLAEQVALVPLTVPLPIALPVSVPVPVPVPVSIRSEAAPISDETTSSTPAVKAVRHLPTPAVLSTTAAPLPVVLHSTPHAAAIPALAPPNVQQVQGGGTDPAAPMPTVNATLLGRGQVVPPSDIPTVTAPLPIALATPAPAPSSSPSPKAGGQIPTNAPKVAAHIDAPATGPTPAPAPSPTPAAEPRQANATPLRQDQIAAPFATIPIEAPPALHTTPTTTAPEAPQDFAALVGKLTEAREAAGLQPVRTVLRHVEFGTVALEFRHEDRGLSVSMASGTPGFNGTVLAAVTATLAGGPAGGQTADPPRDGSPQSQQQGAGSTGSGNGQAPDQRQTATTDPRAGQDHSSGRRQGAPQGRQPGNEAQPQSLASDTGRIGIYA